MTRLSVTRAPDWQARLRCWLAGVVREPFQEGRHDCALFAAGAVEALTGVDYAAPYRGRYSTIRGGIRILRRDGFTDHIALADAHLRQRPAGEPAFAGDLAVLNTEDGPALGVVQGAMIYVLTRDGLRLRPISDAITIFEV